jgi:phytoene dehydrogenase-like protein
MIDTIDDDVCRYLSAVDAVAIYVATVDGTPTRVGFAHDPRKTKAFLARRWPSLTISWLAWFDDSKDEASSFIDEISNNAGELLSKDGSTRTLASVIVHIESLASFEGLTLTPHARAIARAGAASERLDQALATLKAQGELAAFNRAYRTYRQQRQSDGESALPFWAAQQGLRRLIIRHLANNDNFFVPLILSDIRQQFPWFRLHHRTATSPDSASTS